MEPGPGPQLPRQIKPAGSRPGEKVLPPLKNPRGRRERNPFEAGLRLAALALLFLGIPLPCPGAPLTIVNYYSPENRHREKRPRTDYIIVHTTEGASLGSLRKLHRNGEAHYFIDPAGKVFRIIQKDRIALHAGRSMWDGRSNLDDFSIGIELAGFHNREVSAAQYAALKELLRQLQAIYSIPDERVIPHAMVAYGAPNRWQSRSHRGRKRCGMLFARPDIRRKAGLKTGPARDPDVAAGRLVVGDPYLAGVLFGSPGERDKALAMFSGDKVFVIGKGRTAWDVARDQYNSPGTSYIFPDGKTVPGDKIVNWNAIPPGTRVALSGDQRDNPPEGIRELGRDGRTALELAGNEFAAATTIYIFPGGKYRPGNRMTEKEFRALPEGTRVLVGYSLAGKVTPQKKAFEISGRDWNLPSTVYLFPNGRFVTGDQLGEKSIPRDTLVFSRR